MTQKRSKWCYAAGCSGRDLTYTLVSLFFLSYVQFTNLVNETQFLVLMCIIVGCRIWDAVNDPMMGTIISNTKSKFGKYRPWILIGALTNSVVLILMFCLRIDVGDSIGTMGWYNVALLGFLYLIWGMTYTMNDVSYWSLIPVLASDKNDRDKLTTMVAVFASIGSFVAGGIIPIFTPGNMINAYRWFAIIFAVVFVLSQLLVFFFTHDNPQDRFMLTREEMENQAKREPIKLKDMFKILIRNHQLLVMALVLLLYTTASMFLVSFGTNFFYFKFGYDGDLVVIFTVIYAIGTLIAQMFYPLVAHKLKRNTIVKISVYTVIAGYALFAVFGIVDLPKYVMFPLLGICGFIVFGGQGIFYMTMLVMLTNTIEYDEWKTGQRNEAVIFSVRPFMVKLSSAIQAAAVAIVLLGCGLYSITQDIGVIEGQVGAGLIGKEEAKELANEILQQVEQGQLIALTICMTVIPIILMIIGYILLRRKYIIDEELYEKMNREIAERKAKEANELVNNLSQV